MDGLEQNLGYERKMDQVSEQIEELVLDAMLSAFEKIKKRNLVYISSLNCTQDGIKFYPKTGVGINYRPWSKQSDKDPVGSI